MTIDHNCHPFVEPDDAETLAEGNEPERHRIVHVIVPELVFNHVKAQAALSGMPFKTYMQRFLQEAHPYPGHKQGPRNGESQTPASSDEELSRGSACGQHSITSTSEYQQENQ